MTDALVGDLSIKTKLVGLPAGLLDEMLKQQRTAGEQAATILLPNCLILDGTGSGDKVPRSEKSPINKGFLVRYVTRTDVNKRITKSHGVMGGMGGPTCNGWRSGKFVVDGVTVEPAARSARRTLYGNCMPVTLSARRRRAAGSRFSVD
jgi:hypothetical protein